MYLGPNVEDFYGICLRKRPGLYGAVLGTGVALSLAAIVISLGHCAKLWKAPITPLGFCYRRIALFPIAWVLTALVSIAAPRGGPLMEMINRSVEAFTIATFGSVILMLLAHESCACIAPDAGNAEHSCSRCDRMTKALAQQRPQKHFGTLPLGCCLWPLLHAHVLSPRQLLWASRLVRQYAFVDFMSSVLLLYAVLAIPEPSLPGIAFAIKKVVAVSGVLAIYGLRVLYLSTRDMLSEWGITPKFLSIQIVVALSALQELVIRLIINKVDDKGAPCWAEGSNRLVAKFWSEYLRVVEAVALALLVRRAFPADEVHKLRDAQVFFVEMELEEFCAGPRS